MTGIDAWLGLVGAWLAASVAAERGVAPCVTQGYHVGPQLINDPIGTSVAPKPLLCKTVGGTTVLKCPVMPPPPTASWAMLRHHELTQTCACTAHAPDQRKITAQTSRTASADIDGRGYHARFKLGLQPEIQECSVKELISARPDAFE